MEINEKTPAEATVGQEGGNSNGGKSRNNNRRRPRHGKRPHRPENQADSTVVAETGATNATGSKPAPSERERGPVGKDNRAASAGRSTATEEGAARPASPKHQQRVPRQIHRATQADIPSMDNLLIEDCPEESSDVAGYDFDQAEVDRILLRDTQGIHDNTIPDVIPEGKVVIVGVRFRASGKTYFFAPGTLTCKVGQYAIVETARGWEFGEVCIGNRMVAGDLVVPPLRPVIRLATEADIRQNELNHQREEEAYRIGAEKIAAHKLDMKLVSVQYTFDNSKLLFYFTSAGRVDFRDLVKDLASVFHIRIELRQIGIRDEARMLGGIGTCGRTLCCATFLSDFGQVSMKMAKEQNLSLNANKISGCCGRLMCCLRYEHETYMEETRRTPAPGTFVNTPDGPGVVTESYPLQAQVAVSLKNQPDSAPKKYNRADVTTQAGGRRHDHNDHNDHNERNDRNEHNEHRAENTAVENAEPDNDE